MAGGAKGRPLRIGDSVVIPGDEIHVEFTRSGGPGGQNVNKVESCAVLRFSVRDSRSLSAEAKSRLEASLRTRLTREGEVIVRAERHRDRARNLEDGLERLARILESGLHRPAPRKPTRPTRASVRSRLETKRRRSRTKRVRKGDDE